MSAIGDRIAQVIEDAHLKKVQFAEKIRVDQSYISQLVSGKRVPSDRTILDICEKFGVSETWLRDGIGEPYLKREDDDDLKVIFDEIGVFDDEVIKAIVKSYWQLNDSDKAAVRKMVDKMADKLIAE